LSQCRKVIRKRYTRRIHKIIHQLKVWLKQWIIIRANHLEQSIKAVRIINFQNPEEDPLKLIGHKLLSALIRVVLEDHGQDFYQTHQKVSLHLIDTEIHLKIIFLFF
jgi:hypothetical protein